MEGQTAKTSAAKATTARLSPIPSTTKASTRTETQSSSKGLRRNFKDAVAIVTGGASGIGKALVEELANKGARAVIIADRQLDLAQEVATTVMKGSTGTTETKAYEVDVRDFDQVKRVVDETWNSYGRIDFMFNNAGAIVSGPFEKIGVEDFNYVVDVNLRGAANGMHAVYPIMKEQQGFGHIINTASILGLPSIFMEGLSAYAASKYAIVGMSTNLRVEAARYGVNVSVLCPGAVSTPLLLDLGGKFGKDHTDVPKQEMDKLLQSYHPIDPEILARRTLKQVTKNKAIMVIPGFPYKIIWFMNRTFPSLFLSLFQKYNAKHMQKFEKAMDKYKHENNGKHEGAEKK